MDDGESAGGGALPNAVVIGAMKCGTSSLHYYLDLHPEIGMSSPKELDFFVDDYVREDGVALSGNWRRGVAWYAAHFRPGDRVRGESSPNYTAPSVAGVAERMAQVIPDARLVFLARHPIDRIRSHYLHVRLKGSESRPLEEVLAEPGNYLVEQTRYARVLEPFLARYPRDRLLLLRTEDLKAHRRETIRTTFHFLGVDERFWSPKMERERQPTQAKGRLFLLSERIRRSALGRPLMRLGPEAKWLIERLLARSSPPVAKADVAPAMRAALLASFEPDIAFLEREAGWDLAQWRT